MMDRPCSPNKQPKKGRRRSKTYCTPTTKKTPQQRCQASKKSSQILLRRHDTNQTYDLIVIGAGVMGLWTGLFAVQQGKKCLIIEQFPFPHSRGSSAGQSRIYRVAYTIDYQTNMAKDSLPFWENLQERYKQQLILQVPFLRVSEVEDDPTINECAASMFRCKCSSVRDGSQVLNAEQLMQQFPGVKYSSNARGVIDTNGRIFLSDRCMHAIKTLYISSGGQLCDATPINCITPGKIINIFSAGGQVFRAKSVAICCGPWAKKFLAPLGLDLPLTVLKVPTIYYRKLPDAPVPPDFSYLGNHQQYGEIYALPELEYKGMIKVGPHYGPLVDPDARDTADMTEYHNNVSNYVKEHFPFLDPTPAIIENCMYTMTPDNDQIIDRHPQHRNIAFACGFCGAGFKIAPLVGKILLQLLPNTTSNNSSPSCNNLEKRNIPSYIGNHFSVSRFFPLPPQLSTTPTTNPDKSEKQE